MDGALQPAGTTIVTVPPLMPPAAAVTVKAIVLPVCDAETLAVADVSVPDPSFAHTVITGDAAIEARTPAVVELSWICHVCAPVVAGAVAVAPEPYVTTTVWAAVRVTPVIVIVCPDTERMPTDVVVKPGPATVAGGVHPDGTTTVSEPLSMPPVAAV